MAVQPCEQFGTERAEEIDALILSATGSPCPGRTGGQCSLLTACQGATSVCTGPTLSGRTKGRWGVVPESRVIA